ncbi:unnamed protein product [Kluyveromyces dobzhanskii CBS 2104]|uniref:WGS project CCBQ000000000 data, contig 00106 n=1 Tax=Kluyveromyces dobzhanskii CBS 2104 TaxID=1427455 RepID=A0A0A8L7T9_9SACH|nr:unnamed protein product [Kluyveromyces dobzhanskii CBS 2104]
MALPPFLKKFTILLTVVTVIFNLYIYTYPSLSSKQCSWKCHEQSTDQDQPNLVVEYFRDLFQRHDKSDSADVKLMALGDPQIKGIWSNTPYISRLDTYGNDYYLGHIFRTMYNRLKPSHVVVMGDLFSSQWIGDSEFFNRTVRYTKRLFNRDVKWLYDLQEESHAEDGTYAADWKEWADNLNRIREAGSPMNISYGYENVYNWTASENYLFINISGNHDIGYSGDATYQHMARYRELLGKDNYWIEYDAGTDRAWRIVVLNDLLLEGPALQPELLEVNEEFLRRLADQKFNGSTVLLTHIPFYKPTGLCYDGPEFRYYPENYENEPYKVGLLRSQNHLSAKVSNKVLNLLFDTEHPGIILTGHDHEGCETVYNKDRSTGTWTASKTPDPESLSIKEVTVRSMMGEFHGNTGLVTGRFNESTRQWEWDFNLCPFTIQHVWWFTKIITIITGFFWSLAFFF